MREIYLDNASTTPPCREAVEAVAKSLAEVYGNPSSLHRKGFEAERALAESRTAVARAVGAKTGEIYFTSGGTESNNLALFGAALARQRRGKRIVTTAVEHASVSEAISELERRGFEVVRVSPGKDGVVEAGAFLEAVNKDTILVSAMIVNNETGAVLPVAEIARGVKGIAPNALVHCDAVQAFGKMPLDVAKLGAHLVSLSAHKIHGPKGIGALYIKEKAKVTPLFYGGGQEGKMRPGTEAVAQIAGFAAAVKALPDIKAHMEKMKALKVRLAEGLAQLPGVLVNSPDESVPQIVNFSVMGIKSETMLHFLSGKGIFVSSGSACSKGKASPVLTALGLSRERVDSAIRVSFSRFNTIEDVDFLIEALKEGIFSLVRKR